MSYQTTQRNERVLANQSQHTQIRDVQTRTIDQIRTQGLEPSTLEKAKVVMHFLGEGRTELVVMRNGGGRRTRRANRGRTRRSYSKRSTKRL